MTMVSSPLPRPGAIRLPPGGARRAGLAGAAALVLAGCAAGSGSSNDAATRAARAIEPATPTRLLGTIAATGVQIYECQAVASKAPDWVFIAPEAELFDSAGRPVGTHGAGPHWTASNGSRIVGAVRSRADAPQAGAIPWLLLAAQSNAATGMFAGVTYVQRVDTHGGVAPQGGCTTASLGQRVRVPYRAAYRLLVAA